MTVWIEHYRGCSCNYVCLYKRYLPGVCMQHETQAVDWVKRNDYRDKVGHILGEATE